MRTAPSTNLPTETTLIELLRNCCAPLLSGPTPRQREISPMWGVVDDKPCNQVET